MSSYQKPLKTNTDKNNSIFRKIIESIPNISLISIRYSSILLLVILISNIIILPFNFISFNYYYNNLLNINGPLETILPFNDINTYIDFKIKPGVKDEILIKTNFESNNGNNNIIFNELDENLDYDFDLNLNIFCNQHLYDYLLINYEFELNYNNNHDNDNNDYKRFGLLILDCNTKQDDKYLKPKDFLPNWLSNLIFSEFIQNLSLVKIFNKNDYSINIFQNIKLNNQLSFQNLNSINLKLTTSNHEFDQSSFKFIVDINQSYLKISKNLTNLKWYLKEFKIPTYIIGIITLNFITIVTFISIVLSFVIFKQFL
ncbi:hypothetical protein WICMUC_004998 [Wickerhamomyces mucosus]|uniref:Seipin n=1 Tax=Wickerhamomyces mucosus TaxID=1378264 RepID=A0A9P8PCX2_9ASCO|nr:hypothetical protein WICMUC_004998 [Wickerhamomyces mucosus]